MAGKDEIATIHRYLSGEMSAAERELFEQRLLHEQDLAALRDEISVIWTASAAYAGPQFDAGLAQKRFDQSRTSSRPARRMWVRLAAAAVILGLIGVWALFLREQPASLNQFTAADNMRKTLDDGTVISLRKGTIVALPETFGRRQRTVKIISGEAFFEVAPDPERAFRVLNPWAEVVVTGTAFDIHVDTSEGTYTIKVTEGEVRMTPDLSPRAVRIPAGMGYSYDVGTRILDPIYHVDRNAISWQTGELVFINAPLTKVIADLNVHYGKDIRLTDPVVGQCRFTAPLPYTNAELNSIIDAVTTAFAMDYQTQDGILWLIGGKCPPPAED